MMRERAIILPHKCTRSELLLLLLLQCLSMASAIVAAAAMIVKIEKTVSSSRVGDSGSRVSGVKTVRQTTKSQMRRVVNQ